MRTVRLSTRFKLRAGVLLAGSFDVYTVDQDTGAYTVAGQTDVRCSLQPFGSRLTGEPGAQYRDEEIGKRDLFWQDFALDEHTMQVSINGQRWNPVAGTFLNLGLREDTPMMQACSVQHVGPDPA